jgi:hypothetical protein
VSGDDAVKPYIKAGFAAAIAFLSALVTGLTDGSMTALEWVVAVLAAFVAAAGVYNIPYQPKK